jgi:surfeit locus 1 family protein
MPSARTLFAIAGLLSVAAVLACLGAWQLRRADETRALGAQFAAAESALPLERAPDALSDELRFRRLRAHGSYASGHQFLLDNRVREGVAGYEVLTPLKLADDSRWLLVNRGWVPADADRRVLPEVAVDAGPRAVSGRVERLPQPGIRLGAAGAASTAAGDVAVVVYPTSQELGALLGERLLDYELLLDDAAADGFSRDWRAPGLARERHLAYAGQWFLLAVGALAAGVAIAIKSFTAAARAARGGGAA